MTTMSKTSLAGMTALLIAPLAAAVSVLVETTLSEKGADLTAAYTDHRTAMIAGLTINTIALGVLVGGTIWAAVTLGARARTLATIGGILGVAGSLLIMFENGLSASAPILVGALDPTQATSSLDGIKSSVAMSGLQPLSVLGGIGIALLGIAAARVGAPWWAGVAVVIGAIGQAVGFASASRPVTCIAFVVLFLGWAGAVRSLTGTTAPAPATRPAHEATPA